MIMKHTTEITNMLNRYYFYITVDNEFSLQAVEEWTQINELRKKYGVNSNQCITDSVFHALSISNIEEEAEKLFNLCQKI